MKSFDDWLEDMIEVGKLGDNQIYLQRWMIILIFLGVFL